MLLITIGFFASLIGLLVARYIAARVRTKTPMMCPRRAPCEQVVTSTYGTFLGIHNTRLGQWYYFFVAIFFLIIMDGFSFPLQLPLLVLLATGGLLFSLYLLGVQAFILRTWCVWCLASTLCATAIFVCSVLFVHHIIAG